MRRVESHKIVHTIAQQFAKGRKELPATAFARAGPGLDSLDAHGYQRILRRSRFGVEGSRILNNGTIIDAGCRLDDPEVG